MLNILLGWACLRLELHMHNLTCICITKTSDDILSDAILHIKILLYTWISVLLEFIFLKLTLKLENQTGKDSDNNKSVSIKIKLEVLKYLNCGKHQHDMATALVG